MFFCISKLNIQDIGKHPIVVWSSNLWYSSLAKTWIINIPKIYIKTWGTHDFQNDSLVRLTFITGPCVS